MFVSHISGNFKDFHIKMIKQFDDILTKFIENKL